MCTLVNVRPTIYIYIDWKSSNITAHYGCHDMAKFYVLCHMSLCHISLCHDKLMMITASSPTSYNWRKKSFSIWRPSKIVNWGPDLGWGRIRPLAVPNSTEDFRCPHHLEGHSQRSCECLARLQELIYH